MNAASDTTTTPDNGGDFDPRQAADLLDQATQQARRTFTSLNPLLWVFRAVVALVAFGGFWLSVRSQDPYSGPTGTALAVAFTLVAVNIVWSTVAIKRASAGVSGPAERAKRAWFGIMLVVWVAAYAATAPLYHAGPSHPVWGLYPASAPLMIIGLVGAATATACRYWSMAGTSLAIAVVAAVAGFGGPAGSWLIMGVGLCAAMLGTAAFTVCQQRRSVVRP
jgi:hypothetical protein